METKYFKKIEFNESLIEISDELITEKIGLKLNEIKNINIHITDN